MKKLISLCNRFVSAVFSLDLRSLGIMRIALGVLVLFNLLEISSGFDAFIGPSGICPLSDYKLKQHLGWSLYALGDTAWFSAGLMIIHAFFAFLLTIGFWTRTATFFCWLLTFSLINRTPFINFGGDYVLQFMLMWGIFLPLGAKFSVDGFFAKKPVKYPVNVCNPATACFIGQLIFIYVDTGILKNDVCWSDLTAVYYALGSKYFSSPFAAYLMAYPVIWQSLTWLTIFLERYFVLLLLCPVRQPMIRGVIVSVFIAFHTGILIFLNVGWFSFVMIIYWVGFVPAIWWEHGKLSSQEGANVQESGYRWQGIIVLSVLLFEILAMSLNPLKLRLPRFLKKAWHATGLYHPWKMFAPYPVRSNKQIFMRCVFKDGYGDYIVLNPSGHRWAKIYNNLGIEKFEKYNLILNLKHYLLSRWNCTHPLKPAISVEIKVIETPILLPGHKGWSPRIVIY